MHEAVVLCPRCAAPDLLHHAVNDMVRYPGLIAVGGRVDGPERVPEVLRRDFRRHAKRLVWQGQLFAASMDRAALAARTGQLHKLQRFLPPPSSIPTS